MKKSLTLFTILFLTSYTLVCAQDYYIFVETKDKFGLTEELDKHVPKANDVADILTVEQVGELSEIALKTWNIIKTSDLTKDQILMMKERDAVNGLDRKYKIDLESIGVAVTEGLKDGKISAKTIDSAVSKKSEADIISIKSAQRTYAIYNKYLIQPYRYVDNLIVPFARAEVISTIGTSMDYASISLWDSAKNTGTLSDIETGDVRTNITNADITIGGGTTSGSAYMNLTSSASYRHNGTSSTGVLVTGNTDFRTVMFVDSNYTRVSWIRWRNQIANGNGSVIQVNGSNVLIHHNILQDSYSTNNDMSGFLARGDEVYFYRNICQDHEGHCVRGDQFDGSKQVYMWNNTAYAMSSTAFACEGNMDYSVKNNICDEDGSGSCYGGTCDTTAKNLSSDSTSPDGASYQSKNPSYVDETGRDLRLSSGDTVAKDAGDNLGSSPDALDYDPTGTVISGSWSIGAHEEVAGATDTYSGRGIGRSIMRGVMR